MSDAGDSEGVVSISDLDGEGREESRMAGERGDNSDFADLDESLESSPQIRRTLGHLTVEETSSGKAAAERIDRLFFAYGKDEEFDREAREQVRRILRSSAVLPSPQRGRAWCLASGAYDSALRNVGDYDLLCRGLTLSEEMKTQIDKDIDRTSSDPFFRTEEGEAALRRVLVAYATYRPVTGYVQSMNVSRRSTAYLLVNCKQ